MQLGLIKGLLNAEIRCSRNIFYASQQRVRKLPVRLQIIAHHLNINGGRQPEIQNLGNHIRRQEIERISRKGSRQFEPQVMHVPSCGVMLRRQSDHDVRILRSNRRRIAVRKIDTAIGQADVIDDAAQFLRRDLLADFVFYLVTQSRGFFNPRSGWRTHVQREFAAIHRWKKVLSQPRVQSEGEEAGQEEAADKNAAMTNQCFQQPTICASDTLKTMLEPDLKAHQRVLAGTDLMFISLRVGFKEVFRQGWHQSSRKQVRSQHGEYNGLSQRHKEVARHTGEQEHRYKHDANAKSRNQRGYCDLLRAIENRFFYVLSFTEVTVDVFNCDRGIIHQDANGQGQTAQRHQVDGLSQHA